VQTTSGITAADAFDRLFVALAEDLKSPLMRIARQAELFEMVGQAAPQEQAVCLRRNADMMLRLLDSYLLGMRLSREPDALFMFQPVSVAAVLHEACGRLSDVALERNVALELTIGGKYEPVMAHRQALTSALVSLGYSLIEALPAAAAGPLRVQLAAHRTKYGIVAGMYFGAETLTPETLRRAQKLCGHARQPFVDTLPGSGAGVFVADAILAAMRMRLRVGRYQKLPGFAVTLPPSRQLQLV